MMEPITLDSKTTTLRPLPPSLQDIAIKELNEDPKRLADDIMALRHWLHKQQHIGARTNDQFLVSFLRGSKFSMEKAKKKVERYYALQLAIPEVFNERRHVDDPLVQQIIKQGIILQMPLSKDYTGPAVTIIRAGSYDTNKYKFADIIRVGSMFGEIMMMEDDNSTVSGYTEIMDMSNVGGSHLFQLQPDLLRKFSTFADEAMPIRQRGIHFINVPAAFEKGFNALKTFFPAKMLNRITVTSHPDAIFEHLPKSSLPKEYGGDNGCMQDIIDNMQLKIARYRDWFLEARNYGTDEKLRDFGQRISYEHTLGTDGSFRKLDID